MTEPKDFDALDKLFQQTFEKLPETPAANGWDIPSDCVWQGVQANIAAPKAGLGGLKTALLLTTAAVALLTALYFALRRPDPVPPAPQPPASALPAETATPEAAQPLAQPETSSQNQVAPTGKPTAKPSAPKPSNSAPADARKQPTGSQALPGSKSDAPNTIRLKEDQQQKQQDER
jgi:hypothetical protein